MASAPGWNVFFLVAASSFAAGSNVRASRLSTGTLRSVAGASSDGAADMAALAAFRDAQPQSARAPGGCLESWVGGGSARCDESWAGVECNSTTGRVVFLGGGDELEGCGLAAAPESLCMLSELEGLYATANRLRELPGCIANLTHLTDLDVSKNELTVLPSTFDGLKLMYLYVSDNGLAALPSARVFSELEELDISGNQLVSLPDLRASTPLRVLRVRGNRLRELPGWIGTLTHLTDLDVSKNELTVLPSTLGELTKLVYLSASDNGLTTMPSTSAFFELDLLDISGNQLVSLPELQASKALRVLRAGHNKIENISATLALPSATDVHLVNNRCVATRSPCCIFGVCVQCHTHACQWAWVARRTGYRSCRITSERCFLAWHACSSTITGSKPCHTWAAAPTLSGCTRRTTHSQVRPAGLQPCPSWPLLTPATTQYPLSRN
jgi:hypothetical protein